jgi:hypothetical protein
MMTLGVVERRDGGLPGRVDAVMEAMGFALRNIPVARPPPI